MSHVYSFSGLAQAVLTLVSSYSWRGCSTTPDAQRCSRAVYRHDVRDLHASCTTVPTRKRQLTHCVTNRGATMRRYGLRTRRCTVQARAERGRARNKSYISKRRSRVPRFFHYHAQHCLQNSGSPVPHSMGTLPLDAARQRAALTSNPPCYYPRLPP